VEVPKKTTQTLSVMKRGRVAQIKKANTPNKRPRKEKMRHLQNTVNVSQPMVDRHLVDIP
jgi:ABC-type methionine transport system ATPase subunit